MARSLVLIAALAGAALAADTTTVPVLFAGIPMVGSVIHADATATTLSINCPPDSASENCSSFRAGVILTQGPSTCKWNAQVPAETGTGVVSADLDCKLDPAKDEARCTGMIPLGTNSVNAQITMNYSEKMRPVQITAGAEKLTAANTNAASASASATPAPTASGSTSGNAVSKTSAAASSSTGTNAAGPMVTQNAVWAGVAAVVGGALAL